MNVLFNCLLVREAFKDHALYHTISNEVQSTVLYLLSMFVHFFRLQNSCWSKRFSQTIESCPLLQPTLTITWWRPTANQWNKCFIKTCDGELECCQAWVPLPWRAFQPQVRGHKGHNTLFVAQPNNVPPCLDLDRLSPSPLPKLLPSDKLSLSPKWCLEWSRDGLSRNVWTAGKAESACSRPRRLRSALTVA